MSLDLHWTLPNPAAVCRTFSCIRVYRAATADGPFAEVSNPQTRPQLRPDQARYTFRDATGTASAYYSSSFYNPATGAESSRSETQLGKGDPALSLVSVQKIRDEYLWGMTLQDRNGNPLPDAVIERGIRTGVAYVERNLGFCLLPKVVEAEPHDYIFDRQGCYGMIHTDLVPLQSVQGVRLSFVRGAQTGFDLPLADLRTVKWEGSIQWVPGNLVSVQNYSLFWTQLWSGRLGLQGNSVPGAIELSYTAGFKEGEVPADLLDAVCKASCLQPLAVGGDLIGPVGVSSSSISLDGLGQSIGRIASQSGNALASRITAYQSELAASLPKMKAFYLGTRMRVA